MKLKMGKGMSEYKQVTYAGGSMGVINDEGELVHVALDDIDELSEFWDEAQLMRRRGEAIRRSFEQAEKAPRQADQIFWDDPIPWAPKPVRSILSLAIERVNND